MLVRKGIASILERKLHPRHKICIWFSQTMSHDRTNISSNLYYFSDTKELLDNLTSYWALSDGSLTGEWWQMHDPSASNLLGLSVPMAYSVSHHSSFHTATSNEFHLIPPTTPCLSLWHRMVISSWPIWCLSLSALSLLLLLFTYALISIPSIQLSSIIFWVVYMCPARTSNDD